MCVETSNHCSLVHCHVYRRCLQSVEGMPRSRGAAAGSLDVSRTQGETTDSVEPPTCLIVIVIVNLTGSRHLVCYLGEAEPSRENSSTG